MKEWTVAHQREALRRTYEIAAELVGAHPGSLRSDLFVTHARGYCEREETFRMNLVHANFDPARIDREVRRVRALAEGRLVRETGGRYEVAFPDAGDRETFDAHHDPAVNKGEAHRRARQWRGAKVIHVVTRRTRDRARPR